MLLVGGYTERMNEHTPGTARGISAYDFHPADASLRFLGYAPAINPSYLLPDPSRGIVYAVREREAGAEGGAALTAHRVTRAKNGQAHFELLSTIPLNGCHPCHIGRAGNTLLVSSYTSGHLHVVSLDADGRPTELLQEVDLEASDKQRGAHAHCALYLPGQRRVLACDLGDDRIKVFDRGADGRLTARPECSAELSELTGPRHLAPLPDGRHVLVNGECLGRAYLLDAGEEQLKIVAQANVLPERVVEEASGAALRVDAGGKNAYVTDRTFNLITTLRVDTRSAQLQTRDSYPSGGESPRDLSLHPNGEWLFTANTNDSTIGVFRIGSKGKLTLYRTIAKVPTPTSLAWL